MSRQKEIWENLKLRKSFWNPTLQKGWFSLVMFILKQDIWPKLSRYKYNIFQKYKRTKEVIFKIYHEEPAGKFSMSPSFLNKHVQDWLLHNEISFKIVKCSHFLARALRNSQIITTFRVVNKQSLLLLPN